MGDNYRSGLSSRSHFALCRQDRLDEGGGIFFVFIGPIMYVAILAIRAGKKKGKISKKLMG